MLPIKPLLYPKRFELRLTQGQHEAALAHGGAWWVRDLIQAELARLAAAQDVEEKAHAQPETV